MDRIALVIGNSDYSNVGKLNNPKNDADDIASILNKLNFDVTKIMDANLMKSLIPQLCWGEWNSWKR